MAKETLEDIVNNTLDGGKGKFSVEEIEVAKNICRSEEIIAVWGRGYVSEFHSHIPVEKSHQANRVFLASVASLQTKSESCLNQFMEQLILAVICHDVQSRFNVAALRDL